MSKLLIHFDEPTQHHVVSLDGDPVKNCSRVDLKVLPSHVEAILTLNFFYRDVEIDVNVKPEDLHTDLVPLRDEINVVEAAILANRFEISDNGSYNPDDAKRAAIAVLKALLKAGK